MYELVWFLGGAIIYKFLSRLFGLYQATKVFKNLEISILIMLANLTEDMAFIKALRHKNMKEAGLDPEQIEKNRTLDDEFFDRWKKSCIRNIHSSMPTYIKPSFSTWNEGMNIITKFIKGQGREKR
jgi:hypothetical protein